MSFRRGRQGVVGDGQFLVGRANGGELDRADDEGQHHEGQAVADALGAFSLDPEVFDSSNPMTITLLTDLPLLDQGQVTIDASQAGVILDGKLITDSFCGLWIASDSNTVSGLQFVGFHYTALCVDNKYTSIWPGSSGSLSSRAG